MASRLPLLVAVCLLASALGRAKSQSNTLSRPSLTTIPIRVADHLVYMNGQINGSRRLSVVLDTGSSLTVVATNVANEIALRPEGSAEAAGIGHGSSQKLRYAEDVHLFWGDDPARLSIDHQRIAIFTIGFVADQVGVPTDAIFGGNVFRNFRVTVDYDRERATFGPPSSAVEDAGGSIPIKIYGDTPYVQAVLKSADGSGVIGLFLLDSGTTGALVLNQKFLSAHPQVTNGRKFVDAPSANAVGGRIDMRLVRIAGLDFGSFHFSEPVAAVPNSSAGTFANPEIAGFIGAEILRRFIVSWDYAHEQVFLKPDSHLADAFEADASGLRLTVTPPDFGTIRVAVVLADSPAAEAGLRAGDVITTVDGKSGLELWRIAEELKRPGAAPALSILRDGKALTITLHLRRLV